ncbi:MAG: hypothetical protein RJA10_41 [Pseudomonadota bacterium]|jgi:hypothetical protein
MTHQHPNRWHRVPALLLALVLAPALTGCLETFGLKGALTNRVMMSAAQDECTTNSRWVGIDIGAKVDQRDCDAILRALKLQAAMEALAASAAARAAAQGQRGN